ncbi:MAG: tRNA pseudouridine(55) synthase TruB [Thermodesulfovibrionales bacterium]|nr:tRNA pseudouridine(55) synthase TruB [Thermodesulfovibrionales bacterium]
MLLNLNKPRGITSQDAVTAVKRILRIKKAGHTGTLDPIATGVLVICLEKSTRFAGYYSNLDKEYIITMKLGERTDTFDAEGKVIDRKENFSVSEKIFVDTIKKFEGKQLQKVPYFSAAKREGIPLYRLARKGVEFERPLKEVNIYNIELLEFNLPLIKIRVSCSKGTYVRTLVDDIGLHLGTFAHITDLVRTAVGFFRIEDSFGLEDLKAGRYKLLPPDSGLTEFPDIRLREAQADAIRHGMFIDLPSNIKLIEGNLVRLYDEKGFLGLGKVRAGRIKPERLIS